MSDAGSAAAAALVARRWAKTTKAQRQAYSKMMLEAKRRKWLGKVQAKRAKASGSKS